jgi:hypothetical protein
MQNTISAGRSGWKPEVGNIPALLMVIPLVALLALMVLYPLAKLGYDSLAMGQGTGNYVRAVRRQRQWHRFEVVN